jgi:4-amino-4-deoxy-L-arabinose transferase-like glycosyltransferase
MGAAEKSPAIHPPKHLAEKAGELGVLEGTPARLALLAAAAVLLLLRLGAIGVSAPDEPVYAEMAEEVRSFEHGPAGLVLLYLNGKPTDQKPPVYFWAGALFGAPGGRVTETAARLPSALAGIACVWLVLQIGTLLFSRRTALLGAALLVTTPFFAHLGRRASLDVVLAMFELCAFYAFVRIDRGVGRRTTNVALLHGALGLAVLDKGPIGFLLPLAAMVVDLAVERRLADVRAIVPLWSLLLSILPGLAWLTLATWLGPAGWFHGAVIDNLWGRFFLGIYHPRPWHYFFIQFPARALPWSLFWPVIAWAAWRRVFVAHTDPERARAWRFLLAWIGVMFVFFSVSAGKRELYMLPAMPPAALLTADALLVLLAQRSDVPRWWTAGAAVVATAAASGGVALVIRPRVADVDLPRLPGVVLVAITAASAIAWWRLGRVRSPALGRVGVMIAAIFAVELWMFQLVYPSIDREQSAQGIARAAAARVPPGGSVGALAKEGLVAALRYYGGKPVELLESAASMRSFLARGGRVIVAEAVRYDQHMRSVAPMRITERAWTGDRTLYVLTPLDDAANEPRADVGIK